jgi:hypothetical protein
MEGLVMKKIAIVLSLSLIAMAALAQTVAPATPAVQKKVEAPCEAKMRNLLVAPVDAQVIQNTKRHTVWNPAAKPAFVECFQARTRGGGYGKVHGICVYTQAGEIVDVMVNEVTVAGLLCSD